MIASSLHSSLHLSTPCVRILSDAHGHIIIIRHQFTTPSWFVISPIITPPSAVPPCILSLYPSFVDCCLSPADHIQRNTILLATAIISPLFIHLDTIHFGEREPVVLVPIALHGDTDSIDGAINAPGVNMGEV